MQQNKRPVIGISLDWQKEGSFSTRPHYALRQNYFTIIEKMGGLPLGLPYSDADYNAYLSHVDGLLIPGSAYQSDPADYIDTEFNPEGYKPSPRCTYSKELVQQALPFNMPILGICGGMQELIVAQKGGQLYRDVHKAFPHTNINHMRGAPAEATCHAINVQPNTKFHNIVGTTTLQVNSAHTEAVASLPQNACIAATSDDGCIEVIELTNHPFAIGVQYHPEFMVSSADADSKLFTSFIDAARTYTTTK